MVKPPLRLPFPHKEAQTNLPILESIRERWSPLAFSGDTIDPEKIDALFEAARWAPSSFNDQPWIYVYATKKDGVDREKLESLLSPGNSWAKAAYLLIASFTQTKFAKNQKENRHAMHDLGCASGFLVLQLHSLGLIGHQMAGFSVDKANELLGVPASFLPGSMIAVGYPGPAAELPPDLQVREKAKRVRKTQSDFVFRRRFHNR